ncbi:DNA/RNA nuclease SfsA [Megalodesulfovibrio gigas]|uniref:Sugar fermentation stimulation protein homolog n=1 Tax=Megalodesulfovibrio gigas (strain ATCC 19364 / DSM 1382 / NCIMB 9332 / VKM B-1759) TaxID=1121448 RepID=T2G9H1_MEGG1|nr:DNA/RNA nuclease SfsA [Megalodesulfovibrio gigas]AGW12771.1 putative sugar fermentation stimulation protein [Megalodesulfovibrio gigas DSM 1382 = ATCC 19364]
MSNRTVRPVHAIPLLPLPSGSRIVSLLRREKRFLVLVQDGDDAFWVHTNNSGSMVGLVREGRRAVISPAPSPKRKLPWTLEMIELTPGREDWVGVNTLTPNRLLAKAFHAGVLQALVGLHGYTLLRPEAPCGESRIDALLMGPQAPPLWVEAKNVTLVEDEVAAFPDAVTVRGRGHLEVLMERVARGERAAVCCCIQRPDGRCFGPADYIDPAFAATFWRALEAGVEVWPLRVSVSPAGMGLAGRLPLAQRPASGQK